MPRHIFAKPLKHTYTRTPPLEVWKKREIKPSEFQDDIGLQTQPGFTHLGFSTRSLQKCFSLTMSRCTPELMPRSTFAKNIKTDIHENYTTWLVHRKILVNFFFNFLKHQKKSESTGRFYFSITHTTCTTALNLCGTQTSYQWNYKGVTLPNRQSDSQNSRIAPTTPDSTRFSLKTSNRVQSNHTHTHIIN